jgi:hypothetical protein
MDKLIKIQKELKAPKNQRNSFGNYNYRSCEDILEAVKPLLEQSGLLLTISDDIVQLGDRFYVKATAIIIDGDKQVSVSAFARESLDKKGMDTAQITGACSSYARKYALNGLFLIDDTKDADEQDNTQTNKPPVEPKKTNTTKTIGIEDLTFEQYKKMPKDKQEKIKEYFAKKLELPFISEEELKQHLK